jgi:nitrate reductase alpha subunit
MHLYLDHAWMRELGEQLPAYRPPIDHRLMLAGAVPIRSDGSPEVTLRYLTPHSKWSIHSEYQDNLHMLTLFRGGGMLWISREDAEALEIRDNDWIELLNRNGVVAARAVVSHRIPAGAAFMYHAQDRHVQVPISETTGHRGGTHNSPTQIHIKPTHLIGGYAQLAYGFNYYGPTGSQRDEVAVVRKRRTEVEF